MAADNKVKKTEDVLLVLCKSVEKVLSIATKSDITFSPMVQKINKTCLKPDIGCFVLFDGGFSGLVIMNFSAEAALEIYQSYMRNMGMPEDELAKLHTSDEVGDSLAELMNQIIGDFQVELKKEFRVSVNQSQPKMLALTKELMISINTQIDKPQSRKVSFETASHKLFYLEMSMEKTEFLELMPFEKDEDQDLDKLFDNHNIPPKKEQKKPDSNSGVADDDFMKDLGL